MAAAAGVRRPRLRWAAAGLLLVLPGGAGAEGMHCSLPGSDEAFDWTDATLTGIYEMNCKLVRGLNREMETARDSGLLGLRDDDYERAVNSVAECDDAYLKFISGDSCAAAQMAVRAWSGTRTGESVYCTLVSPPFCTRQRASASTWAMLAPLAVTLVLVLGVSLYQFWENRREGSSQRREPSSQTSPQATGRTERRRPEKQPKDNMIDFWGGHCLHHLTQAPASASTVSGHHVAAVFHAYTHGFGFQAQSAENQYEHFLSLWRSQVAMVADEAVGTRQAVAEGQLLERALDALHAELLDGFRRWRAHAAPRLGAPPADGPELLRDEELLQELGVDASSVTSGEQGRKLAEMVVFLLVWGEAGNLRFMPEVLYFITDLVLASGFIRNARGHDTWFLVNIVRPIYNVVFDEHYQDVRISLPVHGHERVTWQKARLRDGFGDYLPSHVANHDDWNELFCNPNKLADSLKMKTPFRGVSQLLHEFEKKERFGRLPYVDWASSLSAANAKTHRELHSLVGVFATTHRVILLHVVMFAVSMCLECGGENEELWASSSPGRGQLGGDSTLARFAFVGLLVPLHALARAFALWRVTGRAVPHDALFLAPLVTFVFLRTGSFGWTSGVLMASLHICVSAVGLAFLLLVPSAYYKRFPFESPTPATTRIKVLRYAAWALTLSLKFYTGRVVFRALNSTIEELQISRPGHESLDQIGQLYLSVAWCSDVLLWMVLWSTTLALYFVDTQYWFLVLCTIVGILTTLVRRFAANEGVCWLKNCWGVLRRGDGMSKLTERFQQKVLYYVLERDRGNAFKVLWNEIVQEMRDEDDISSDDKGRMQIRQIRSHPDRAGELIWPEILEGAPCSLWPDAGLPTNDDARWRLLALSRGLRLSVPRPYRAPYIPGITVLIPFFTEDVYTDMSQRELLMWLTHRYKDEFENYETRRNQENPIDREKDREWTALRQQTLFRTIQGMCLYRKAIEKHHEVQGIQQVDRNCKLLRDDSWKDDIFMCLVAMQVYAFGNTQPDRIRDTHGLLTNEKFARCLKVAYIDYKPLEQDAANIDNVHTGQTCRYYSCLIDSSCQLKDEQGALLSVRARPKFQIELPGFPVLGDGKGDNQNHCIPFTRGHYIQTMDMNQGAYFEQMLLLPCALGEFRRTRDDPDASKKILGFPEQITSDIGSVGDFAASAEQAFGTILQRAYNVLGARMHYGHPDIMNKLYMMQQGGVSKATKTLHLSEDIFAGMDFTLRGGGRRIKHCEYMAFAKGRDMGFAAVLTFFSKLSSGTGEQILTRQTFRLEQVLELPEALCFYYAHAGYYLIQFMISWAMPVIVFVWLLVLLSGCEGEVCVAVKTSTAEAMIPLLSALCSRTLVLFLLVSSLPWIAESSMQRGVAFTLGKLLTSYRTASPLLFVFQSKCIGHYIMNECRYGGATYSATGRGLPTQRVPFIGLKKETDVWGKREFVGLFHDYSAIAHYDGAMLLVGLILVWQAEGIPSSEYSSHTSFSGVVWSYLSSRLFWIFFCCGLVIISWLWAPYVFNPYQFRWDQDWAPCSDAQPVPVPTDRKKQDFKTDLKDLKKFFFDKGGVEWLEWYWKERVKPGRKSYRLYIMIWDIGFVLFAFAVASWYLSVAVKVDVLSTLFSEGSGIERLYVYALLPPICGSSICCVVAVLICYFRGGPLRPTADAENDGRRSALMDAGFLGHCPLAVLACAVVLADCCESYWTLWDLHTVKWRKALLAGLVLKMILLSAMTMVGEGTLRSPAFTSWPQVARALLEAWVCAHRMAKDALTCLIILPPLALRVLLDSLNRCVSERNLHHQLLYRDWGHEKAMLQPAGLEEGLLPRGRR